MAQAALALVYLKSTISSFFREDLAQDTFEYVLIIGGIVVAVILAVATPLGSTVIDAVLSGVCSAISTIPSITVSC